MYFVTRNEVPTFFFAVFRNLLFLVFFKGQVTRRRKEQSTLNATHSAVQERAAQGPEGPRRSAGTCIDGMAAMDTHCHGSRQISCLCPSSCSWGLCCQWALLMVGTGPHLQCRPASARQINKSIRRNTTACCYLN